MYLLKQTKNRPVWKSIQLALGLMLLLIGAGTMAHAQGLSASQGNQELNMTDLLNLPGKTLAEGANKRAAGKFRVASYRVEEVTLPHSVEAEVGGVRTEVNKAFRITITGGPFPVRALPPVLWIDDVAVGYGVESEDLDRITAVTYDASLVREGAAIYLSYGDKKSKEDRVQVPEKLTLTGAKGGN